MDDTQRIDLLEKWGTIGIEQYPCGSTSIGGQIDDEEVHPSLREAIDAYVISGGQR